MRSAGGEVQGMQGDVWQSGKSLENSPYARKPKEFPESPTPPYTPYTADGDTDRWYASAVAEYEARTGEKVQANQAPAASLPQALELRIYRCLCELDEHPTLHYAWHATGAPPIPEPGTPVTIVIVVRRPEGGFLAGELLVPRERFDFAGITAALEQVTEPHPAGTCDTTASHPTEPTYPRPRREGP